MISRNLNSGPNYYKSYVSENDRKPLLIADNVDKEKLKHFHSPNEDQFDKNLAQLKHIVRATRQI